MRDETPHFYGRRKGRRLRTNMREMLERRLPELRFRPESPAEAQFDSAPRDMFWKSDLVAVRILPPLPRRVRSRIYRCRALHQRRCQPCSSMSRNGLNNIRIWDDDVRLILGGLESGSLAGAYVLFPDPWPKRRHAARRILAPMSWTSWHG